MYEKVEVISNSKIYFTVVSISIMFCWLLAESDGHFWWPAEFENMANPDLENPKHLHNPGHVYC